MFICLVHLELTTSFYTVFLGSIYCYCSLRRKEAIPYFKTFRRYTGTCLTCPTTCSSFYKATMSTLPVLLHVQPAAELRCYSSIPQSIVSLPSFSGSGSDSVQSTKRRPRLAHAVRQEAAHNGAHGREGRLRESPQELRQ